MIVTVADMRKVKYCVDGTKLFFKKHDLDWKEFVLNGLDEEEFAKTNDGLADKMVEAAHERRK